MERVTRLVYIIIPIGNDDYGVDPVEPGSSDNPPDCHIDFSSLSAFPAKKKRPAKRLVFFGAGDEARTRYLHLGKVALYRMSYTRNGHDVL